MQKTGAITIGAVLKVLSANSIKHYQWRERWGVEQDLQYAVFFFFLSVSVRWPAREAHIRKVINYYWSIQ